MLKYIFHRVKKPVNPPHSFHVERLHAAANQVNYIANSVRSWFRYARRQTAHAAIVRFNEREEKASEH